MSLPHYQVAILGAGVAGAAACHALRARSSLLLEREDFVGGRTRSRSYLEGVWANFGAGYFSADKTTILRLGDEVGVSFLKFDDGALTGDFMPAGLDTDDIAQIRQIKRRIAAEQSKRRDPASPELDRVSFAEWLGPVRPNARHYWNMWCSTMSGPMEEVSLYGVLLMSGANRSSAFTADDVAYDPRGNMVVAGGNGRIAERLVETSAADVKLGHDVQSVERDGHGRYLIKCGTVSGVVEYGADAIVCALPAPVVTKIFQSLPSSKRAALETIRYGRIIGMPVIVGPKAGDYPRFRPLAEFRADAVYCETEFLLRSPTDLDEVGAYFVCQVYDRASRVLWGDSDAPIQAGVFAAFERRFPALADRVHEIGVQRWLHGLPQYNLGRMAVTPDLVRSVEGIFFCGDYTDVTHTDGAAKSGLRAAAAASKYLHELGVS